jgi:hypothetical protein
MRKFVPLPTTSNSTAALARRSPTMPPPTGYAAADLAAIQAAVADAKAWQAGQPKGADGLAAKVEVVLAPGTYSLCPAGTSTPAPPQGGGGQYCLLFNNWENLADTRPGPSSSIRTRGTSTSSSRAT